jgi:hypothetical protein
VPITYYLVPRVDGAVSTAPGAELETAEAWC